MWIERPQQIGTNLSNRLTPSGSIQIRAAENGISVCALSFFCSTSMTHFSVAAYFTHKSVDGLGIIDDVLGPSTAPIPDNMFQSTRVSKSRNGTSTSVKANKDTAPSTVKLKDQTPPSRTYAAFPAPFVPPASSQDSPNIPSPQSSSQPTSQAYETYYQHQAIATPSSARYSASSLPRGAPVQQPNMMDESGSVPRSSRFSPDERFSTYASDLPQQRKRSAGIYHPYPSSNRGSTYQSSLIDYDNTGARSKSHSRRSSGNGPYAPDSNMLSSSLSSPQQLPTQLHQPDAGTQNQNMYPGWYNEAIAPQYPSDSRFQVSPILSDSTATYMGASSPTSSSSSSYTLPSHHPNLLTLIIYSTMSSYPKTIEALTISKVC
jgi:hypothetical protein